MYIIFEGTVGRKKMRPREDMVVRKRNGVDVEVPFRRAGVWTPDLTQYPTKDPKTGQRRRRRVPVQIVLPENERGKRLLSFLEPDRRILVQGRLTHQPNTGINPETGETIIYPNPKVYVDRIDFLDASREHQAKRLTQLWVGKEIMDEEQAERCVAAVRDHYQALKDDNGDAPEQPEEITEEDNGDEEKPF